MKTIDIIFIVFSILLVIIFIFVVRKIYLAYLGVKRKISGEINTIKTVTGGIINSESINEIKNVIKNDRERPKSLDGMDKIYSPLINKDFPNVNLEEFKTRAKDSLVRIFQSIENKDINKLKGVSDLIVNKVSILIKNQDKLNQREYFDNININNIVISDYKRRNGYLSIIYQISVGYNHYIIQNGIDLVYGSKTSIQQDKYEISFAYIQDVDKIDEEDMNAGVFGLNCPNCAAPIKTIGQKYCEYCGTGVVDIDIKSWIVLDFSKIN